jgi:proteasome lid subunit RPN8/RPN11
MKKGKSSIHLDEIDIIQMAYSAMEMYVEKKFKETFGLFLGKKDLKPLRAIYNVSFIQILVNGQRTDDSVYYSEKTLKKLSELFNFEIIGDWHSHPNGNNQPSRTDVLHSLKMHDAEAVFAILAVDKNERPEEKANDSFILRSKTHITCNFYEFKIEIRFYRLNPGIKKIRMDKKINEQIELIRPVCRPRPKIHKGGIRSVHII